MKVRSTLGLDGALKNVPKEWASEFEEIQRTAARPIGWKTLGMSVQLLGLRAKQLGHAHPNPYLGRSGLHERTMD